MREILVAVEADRQSARSLGTSAIPAHLPLLSDAQLAAVASVIGTNDHPAAVAFAAQVGAQQAGRRQP